MLRRALAGLFAAALLVLAPTAAFGYAEDEFDIAVSTTNPDPGESLTVTVTAETGTDVTLTVTSDDPNVSDDDIQIAGTKSLTKAAVNNAATFTVTLTEEAVYTLVATDEEGNEIDTVTVVVAAPDAAAPGSPAAPGDGAAAPGLPETGASATPLIIGGIALLVVGGAALFFARRGKVSA